MKIVSSAVIVAVAFLTLVSTPAQAQSNGPPIRMLPPIEQAAHRQIAWQAADPKEEADPADPQVPLTESEIQELLKLLPKLPEMPTPAEEDEKQETEEKEAEKKKLGENESIGQAPPEENLLFLRSSTVLLQPGEYQIDFGLRYVWQEIQFPSVVGGALVNSRARFRQLVVPAALRVGWTEDVQLFANLPFGGALTEFSNFLEDDYTSVFGLGDFTTGMTIHLQEAECCEPDIIGTISITAPTGAAPLNPSFFNAALGTGFWGASVGLTAIKESDPAVIFGSVGYTHLFGRDLGGAFFQPGEIFTYSFGMGFAINDCLTLSSIFQGGFQNNGELGGLTIRNSSLEPFSLRMALTAVLNPCKIVEPYINFGLNEDAPEADFGVIITRSF